MGTELATDREWNHDLSLDWHLGQDPMRQGLRRWMEDLGRVYGERAPLWRHDPDPEGFHWIDVSDKENSVLSYARRDGEDHLVVVINLTPLPRDDYRIGAPAAGTYTCLLSSDDARYGGGGAPTRSPVPTEPQPFHGYPQSMVVTLPPLAVVVMAPERGA
jgi:1,4-alpha-glucan branching enzyme